MALQVLRRARRSTHLRAMLARREGVLRARAVGRGVDAHRTARWLQQRRMFST
jgi:hypothetical protein